MELQQKRLLLTAIIFLVIVVALIVPFSQFSSGAQNATFTVYLILGNNNPNITWVQSGVIATPIPGGYTTIYIAFNATDPDGYLNLNNATASIYLNLTGEQSRYNSSCSAVAGSGNTTLFNCSINIWYFDSAGSWTVNASIYDLSSGFANNTGLTTSVNSLTAVSINASSMSFSANLGQNNVPASTNPLIIDNIGNTNISVINLTAYELNKTTEVIAASQFKANFTSNSTLHTLSNNTKVLLVNASVPRDMPSFARNESLYLYVNVPAAGLTAGTFQSRANWVIDVS